MTDQEITPTLEPPAPHLHDAVGDEAVVDEAVAVIDEALARMMQRDLVASGEVADLLLDVRTILTGR